MDKIDKTNDELLELDTTVNGMVLKELLEKLNEIIDWINSQ